MIYYSYDKNLGYLPEKSAEKITLPGLEHGFFFGIKIPMSSQWTMTSIYEAITGVKVSESSAVDPGTVAMHASEDIKSRLHAQIWAYTNLHGYSPEKAFIAAYDDALADVISKQGCSPFIKEEKSHENK